MKRLTIKKLENKLGNVRQMVGTDFLKIPLSLVRCINKHHISPTKEKKVGNEWCESAARCDWKFRRKMTHLVSYESDPPVRWKVTRLS